MKRIKYFLVVTALMLAVWLLHLSNTSVSNSNASNDNDVEKSLVRAEPGITFMDILNAADLKAGALAAVKSGDKQALLDWQQKAVEVGLAANLPEQDMKFLAGERGLDFMRFRARRTLFYQDFERYYYGLKDITPLKQAYPEASGLFAKADEMISQRDIAIDDIARELAGSSGDYRLFVKQAREQWRQSSQQKL